MIAYREFELDNGLQVFVLPDPTVSVAVVNVLYDVGSRDEEENKTGFAHLFEHLMFGGSKNIPSYDEPLQRVGGENNAFTTPDYTNYYLTVPSHNIETGLWLESDRMLSLSFNPEVLEVQRKVVIEEFRQRYLNQPYGDAMHHLRSLSYTTHPYKWPTIGKEISHIQDATMGDVKSFFKKHYCPNNAILVIGGDVEFEEVQLLVQKWFGAIPRGPEKERKIPSEPSQIEERIQQVSAEVPQKVIYKAWHMPGRMSEEYYSCDLLSDILGRGKSSRLYKSLIQEKSSFTKIHCHVSGSVDPGWLMVQGFVKDELSFEEANGEIESIVYGIKDTEITSEEHEKVINQALITARYSRMELLEKCMQLAYFAMLGEANRVNTEQDHIEQVSKSALKGVASKYLIKENCSTLYYAPS